MHNDTYFRMMRVMNFLLLGIKFSVLEVDVKCCLTPQRKNVFII